MRVRESIRYVREVLQVSEHLARQTGELVAVQIEAPTGDTHVSRTSREGEREEGARGRARKTRERASIYEHLHTHLHTHACTWH